MITAIIRNRENTLVLDFPRSIYDLYEKLQSIGIMQPPKQIPLTDNEGEDIGVKLFSESDFGQHLLLTLNEKNTIADANMLTLVIGAASEDIKEELEQNILYDQYDSMDEVINAVRQMTQDAGPVKAVFFCPLVGNIDEGDGDMFTVGDSYLKDKTIVTASEFITRMLEENADEMMHTKTYADYIATRPHAERFGSHGLFTDDGVAVDLQKVSDELNAHTGNVWTAIVSLRREDAERLGYDNGSRWRDMLRSQTQTLSENLKIPMSNLRWFAAFHNESYHPHVHMIVYSTDPTEGYLSEKGLMALRSSFAKDIFAQDLLCEYKKQTEHRDTLKAQSREVPC